MNTERDSQSACDPVILTSILLITEGDSHSCSMSCSHVLKMLSQVERENHQWLHQRAVFHQKSGGGVFRIEIKRSVILYIASLAEWSGSLFLRIE